MLQGHTTTNTGNVARRCFAEPTKFAEALEVDSELVSRLSTIILAFKSKQLLDLGKLNEYCQTTYKMYFSLYPWARMSPTIHKILMDGCGVANYF